MDQVQAHGQGVTAADIHEELRLFRDEARRFRKLFTSESYRTVVGRFGEMLGDTCDRLVTLLGEMAPTLRTGQTPPPGQWDAWLLLGGRGAGKDFAGQAWIRSQVEKGAMDIVVVVPGREHVEDAVQGLYSAFPAGQRPARTRSAGRRTLLFSSGPAVMFYDSTEPEALPDSCGAAWGNDLVQWANPEAVLRRLRRAATCRAGRGRILLTTTPGDSINELLNELLADRTVVSTTIRTSDNTSLDPAHARRLQAKYGNTALGRQELDGAMPA